MVRSAERRDGERERAALLNFYVTPSSPQGSCGKHSLQYRRLPKARAMTGEFAASWMPSVFVPLVGILGPAVAMALLFNVIEARN
jgi:photosystem I subunit 8